VDAAHDGKRLRWYLQHCVPLQGSKTSYSKRESEQLITTGKVQLNGKVEMHSSRILKAGDFVVLGTSAVPSEMRSQNSASLEIIDSWSSTCFIVWKPVGMRPIGSFDENTMERIFSEQQNGIYKSMSKIDTGCSGLCLLSSEVAIDQAKSSPLTHIFTALVHGHVPVQWASGVDINLSIDELRRWKKKRKAANDTHSFCRAQVRCLEQTSARETLPALSTVQISVSSDVSGLANIISYYLRKDAAHPVVGDRFTSSEYLALPRSIRNRLKQRLCMSCTGIASKTQRTEHPLPEKLRATFWDDHCENAFPGLNTKLIGNTD
jgi:23S rRNA-/tRNA-specific pseudouridylate synthase